MAAVLPAEFVGGPDQAEVRLVDEGSRLQGLIGGLGRHPRAGELPQLVADEREQVGGSLAVTGRRGVEESRHIGHSASVTLTAGSGMENGSRTAR